MVTKIPLRTHLLTAEDDIVQVVRQYAEKVVVPGDLIAVAETVVAICQGRYISPDRVKSGYLARFLSRFPGRHGSLTSPATMELAIQEVGYWRIVLAAAAGAVGRILKIKGLFYQIAGLPVALIDDVAGTMPPYHQFIVLGPQNANQISQDIADTLGVDAVIIDANDLGFVDVVGASKEVPRDGVTRLFADNPAGNYEQQTPVTVIKDYRQQIKGWV